MKLSEALEYTVVVAKGMGYTEQMIKGFLWEVKERLYEIDDLSKEAVDELIEEIF